MAGEETGRYLSPPSTAGVHHHHRSRSVKGRQSFRETEESFAYERKRRNSMPSVNKIQLSSSYTDLAKEKDKDYDENLRRVRSFKTTSKGALVNRGDSFKRKTQKEKLLTLANQSREDNLNNAGNNNQQVTVTLKSFNPVYRVVMLGPAGVGKSALTDQFMTSEYIGPTDNTSIDNEEEKIITVQLDGEESTLSFIDPEDDEVDLDETKVDAYIVVFSSNDRNSFDVAVETLHQLREELATDKAIILVANKIDLARKRKIDIEEARSTALKYDCKYAETSAALNHHVDELLVGILSQIRLKQNPELVQEIPDTHTKKHKERKGSFKVAKGLLNKLFRKSSKRDKSCENLYEL
ncbi:ras-related protein Ral-B-like [Mytilus trossulus]|uniref:ras-related protein Ral-B-like n=1 Tax=Mytilus trossulus TaxID=6551 RepID=UPI0030056686